MMSLLNRIFSRIGLEFDGELGIYIHKDTRIPITVCYDENNQELVLLDQTKLPYELATWRTSDWKEAGLAIKRMIVRGSQAIGCAVGYAFLLAANSFCHLGSSEFLHELKKAYSYLRATRPTAYPLIWALNIELQAAEKLVSEGKNVSDVTVSIKRIADFILASDLIMSWFLRQEGKRYLQDGDVILTHCNGGSLSSSFGGHALGMIEEAYVEGTDLMVIAKETRPRCQGYKLTVWELNQVGVPTIIVTDNMIVSSFRRFKVSKVVLGVDRVAKDGSVANKIGSVDIAYIAHAHDIPFYYATSYSTIDLSTERGENIPIEERNIEEIVRFYRLEAMKLKEEGKVSCRGLDEWPATAMLSKRPVRGKVVIYNPAFDITPPGLITAIITDIGSFRPVEIGMLTKDEIEQRVRQRLAKWEIAIPEGVRIYL